MAQIISSNLQTRLDSTERDLIDLYELYEYNQTSLQPANALKRWSSTRITWNGSDYERAVVSRGDVSRFMGASFNSVSIQLSNIEELIGGYAFHYGFEGKRLVVRIVSRSVSDSSIVAFVGRCEKAVEVDRKTVQITAKQDLGSIEVEIPTREIAHKCPLKFKGTECLGDEALGSKSAAYQAASVCNKSHDQCVEYANTEFFQGFRNNGFKGTFKVKQQRGGAGGAFLSLIGLGSKKVKKQWTAQAESALGSAIPLVFGRAQVESIPLVFADTGQYVAFLSGLCEGPVSHITNVRNVSPGFASTFQAGPFTHVGDYGSNVDQQQDGFFSSSGDSYSKTSYVEGTIKGENPDTGDPAPQIVALVRGQKVLTPTSGGVWSIAAWSDNPVALLRYLITDSRILNHPSALIDDAVAFETYNYCNEIISDASKSEQLYLPNAVSAIAGVDFKRYRSTSLIDTYWYRWALGIDTVTPPEFRETAYSFFDPTAPPSSITAINYLRRRFTANSFLADKVKAVDYIYKTLLPTFRGYLVTSATGKIQIRSEKSADSTLVRTTTSAGATELPIEDVEPWKSAVAAGYRVLALIGLGLSTSEVMRVLTTRYTTTSNSITLAVSTTGGGVTLTRSGATLTGATDTTTTATGTVTVGGTPAAGNTGTITLDGVGVTYTLNANDTTATVGALLRDLINANTTLNRYLKATWDGANLVTITSKLGFIQFGAETTDHSHSAAEEIIRVASSFTPAAQDVNTRSNIVEGSMKWPLGSKQGSYNQFVLKYVDAIADFSEVEIRENDYDHQEQIGKINKIEIDGSAIDNYHQADRLLKAAKVKYRDNDWFASWETGPAALVLEEGDVVAITDPTGVFRNRAVRLEEVKITSDFKVRCTGRLYTSSLFPDSADVRTVPLPTAQYYPDAGPGQPTALTLSEPTPGTVRGTFAFATYPGEQTARVEYKAAASGTWIDSGVIVRPDASLNGQFELSGVAVGSTNFRVTPYNKHNKAGTVSATATITVSGTTVALEYIIGDGVNAIGTGLQDYIHLPFGFTITEWSLLGDVTGSIVVDLWVDAYASYPPTVADSIVAAAKPTISSANKNQSSTLTGWTTTIAANSVLAINVDSVTSFTRVTLSLKVSRT